MGVKWYVIEEFLNLYTLALHFSNSVNLFRNDEVLRINERMTGVSYAKFHREVSATSDSESIFFYYSSKKSSQKKWVTISETAVHESSIWKREKSDSRSNKYFFLFLEHSKNLYDIFLIFDRSLCRRSPYIEGLVHILHRKVLQFQRARNDLLHLKSSELIN